MNEANQLDNAFHVGCVRRNLHDVAMKSKYPYSFCHKLNKRCQFTRLYVQDILTCECGEDVYSHFEWVWLDNEESNIDIYENKKVVVFNPIFSAGTAAVVGSIQFTKNRHFYWEVKILSNLYGTDMMIGIGTPYVNISYWQLHYGSMLGEDEHSWGYSYHGRLHHKGKTQPYSSKFDMGSIIGVHLDMCAGTLEYYLNRKPLGVAFRNLKQFNELRPMVCCTTSNSFARIVCTVSEDPSLQLSCLGVIRKYPQLMKKFRSIPGLCKLFEERYFWMTTPAYDGETDEDKAQDNSEDKTRKKEKKQKYSRKLS